MSVVAYRAENAQQLRRRLFDPPNAVVDQGIDLKRKFVPVVLTPEPEPIAAPEPEPMLVEPVVPAEPPPPPDVPMFLIGPMVNDIIETVAAYYKLTPRDLISSRRTQNVVRPRQIVMWLAKNLTTRSMPYIGKRLNDRDHTTVLHGVRKIEAMRQTDPEMQRDLDILKAKLSPQSSQSPVSTA